METASPVQVPAVLQVLAQELKEVALLEVVLLGAVWFMVQL